MGIPYPDKYCFNAGIAISPKWNTPAANAASASPARNAALKCSIFPAPPDATTGIATTGATHVELRRHIRHEFHREQYW